MSDASAHADVAVTRQGRRIELKMSSHPATLRRVRHELEDFGRDAGLSAEQADQIGLVLNEALANVMRHQYGGAMDQPIVVAFEPVEHGGRGAVMITIRDWGKPFDPEKLPWKTAEARTQVDPDPDQIKPGGLGLLCMRRLMDEVTFTPQTDGMLLTMVKKLKGA